MKETQQSICEWADATFGVPVSDASIAARALVELAELVTACVNGEPAEIIGEEIADVVIVLARLGRSAGIDVIAITERGTRFQLRCSALTHAARAVEFLGSTLRALEIGGNTRISAAVIALLRIAKSIAVDLTSAVDRKMAINRARRWKLDGNGHGSHVEEST